MAANTKRDRCENDSRAWATHETAALSGEKKNLGASTGWKPRNHFFFSGLIRYRLNCDYNRDGHIFISFVFPQFTLLLFYFLCGL